MALVLVLIFVPSVSHFVSMVFFTRTLCEVGTFVPGVR